MYDIIKYFFFFIIFYSFIILSLLLISDLYFKKYDLKKIKYYGILWNLNNRRILSLALISIRELFIIYSLLIIKNNIYAFLFLIIITIIYNVINIKFLNIIFDLILNIIIYLIIISKDIFIDYIIHVNFIWYGLILFIISIIFGFLCSFYIYLKEILNIFSKKKYKKGMNK